MPLARISPPRFPRHRAAASLKQELLPLPAPPVVGRFPRHRAAASLKPQSLGGEQAGEYVFSAASGRGLIEARKS